MTVVEYVAKFEELVKFCPNYNNAEAEVSKGIKFERGLQPETKKGIGYHEIYRFPMLVNKCKIDDKDSRARCAHYKRLSEKKGKNQYLGKMYSALADKGNQKASYEKRTSREETQSFVKCFKCGIMGHHTNDYKSSEKRCFKCGNIEHLVTDCKGSTLSFLNCGDSGHISTHFQKPRKVQSGEKAFVLNGSETTGINRLVQVSFPKFDASDELFVSAKQVDESMKDDAKMFMILASMKDKIKFVIDDISNLSLEPEVEFTIDLVPGTSPVLVAPYRMSVSEPSEIRK
ncbi:uncharacterized protein LOC127103773 [Lathyrus oleraceus]|uniref:uncharacterized protein LOC127103773 n=1 Tax=Pisum sativum TaxID=3888 RepID=UPI0021D1D56E|nr:uncharacterized protein LOC127103773 [Pisum sativum]